MKSNIRREKASDYDAVYSLNREVFGQVDEVNLADALRKSSALFPELSLVGWVGVHILFTKLIIRHHSGNAFRCLALAGVSGVVEYPEEFEAV